MRKYLLTIIPVLIFIKTLSVSGASAQSWCEPSIDLSADFPLKTKDQNDLGYCFAFATTSLIENYRCRLSAKRPCESLSTMDAIAQYPDSLKPNLNGYSSADDEYQEGGYPAELLETIKKKGLCLESEAPYKKFETSSQREAWNRLLEIYKKYPKASTHGLVEDIRARWSNISECQDQFAVVESVEEQMTLELDFYPSAIARYESGEVTAVEDGMTMLKDWSPADIEEALLERNGRAFLQTVLLPGWCITHRKKDDYGVTHLNYWPPDKYSKTSVEKHISNRLREGIPIAVSMKCGPSNPICTGAGDSAHAFVVKGMHLNPDSGKCELLVLNSWGEGWQSTNNGGYVEADEVIKNAYDLTWLAQPRQVTQ